jgi:hypothetical protein
MVTCGNLAAHIQVGVVSLNSNCWRALCLCAADAAVGCVQVSEFKRPVKPLVLYEFQGCPFCKKVSQMGIAALSD